MGIRKGSRGVTLLELCAGLAVVAILAGLATPGFRASLRAAAVRTAAYDLMAGVQQTRASAIVEAPAWTRRPRLSSKRCSLSSLIGIGAWPRR